MSTDNTIIVEAHDRASRDLQPEEASRLLPEQATDRGPVITRHRFRALTPSLSTVPGYGLIQELDLL